MASDPLRYFRVEARELLEQLAKGILALEAEEPPADVVPRLLRAAHTLKGAARVVRQSEIAEQAHALEDLLAPLRDGPAAGPREPLERALGLVDAMVARLAGLAPPTPAGIAAQPRSDELFRTLRADVSELDGLLDGLAEAHASLAALQPARAALEHARRLAGLASERELAPRRHDAASARGRPVAEELAALLEGTERGLARALERVDRELAQARDAGERLRLLPAGALFASLERTVRDAARALGKAAAFQTTGADVRLDAHVLGTLHAALIQLVRNAVAHGVEHPAERRRAGKPEAGTVGLEVVLRGSRVAFICSDDGRGIDLAGVRHALERKGALGRDAPELPPAELLRLLPAAGISTSDTPTQESGRGVGLDLVRETVSALGGELQLGTRAGAGTRVELVVPVSLSSLPALMVEAGTTVAAIPLDAVRRTLRLAPGDLRGGAGGESLLHDGALVPFLPLASLLQPSRRAEAKPGGWSVVVLGAAEGAGAALGVDRLLGTATVLVRPLPAPLRAASIAAGASFDAAGDPQLVLDPERTATALRRFERAPAPLAALPQSILVVDDSLTTRMLEQSILESAGYAVDLASSGPEALEKLRGRRYGLLLVDIEMPGMDGFELLERLQADPALRGTPAILVTSRSSSEDRARGERAGARAYMAKSEFDQGVLLGRIRGLLEAH